LAKPGSLLSLQGLTKNFGGLIAVNEVELEVPHGEICGIIGPNGAGKTTLFNLVAGEIRPSAGTIYLDGHNVVGLPSYKIARLGVARSFQLVHLFESMTVLENILVGAERHERLGLCPALTHFGIYGKNLRAALQRTEYAMALVGLEHIAERIVASLSFGQQRLVGMARALAAQPCLLLLDEPGAGLSQTEIQILANAIFRARADGITILLIAHNVDLVMSLCDHVAVMNFGKKIADGRPEEVRRSDAVVEAYLGS
jgi:branched-chain amino acid transport system ATP-binding protein